MDKDKEVSPIDTLEKFKQFCEMFAKANNRELAEEDFEYKEGVVKYNTIFNVEQGESNGVIIWDEETGEITWEDFWDLEVNDLIESLTQEFVPEGERKYPMYVKVYVKASDRKTAMDRLKVGLSMAGKQLKEDGIGVYDVARDSYGIANC